MTLHDPTEAHRIALAQAQVLEAARAAGRARRVLPGSPVGPVLSGRFDAFTDATEKLHDAIDALDEAERTPTDATD